MLRTLTIWWLKGLVKKLQEHLNQLSYYIEYENHAEVHKDIMTKTYKEIEYIKTKIVEVLDFIEFGKIVYEKSK